MTTEIVLDRRVAGVDERSAGDLSARLADEVIWFVESATGVHQPLPQPVAAGLDAVALLLTSGQVGAAEVHAMLGEALSPVLAPLQIPTLVQRLAHLVG